jgi:hypothetical protein
MIDQDHWTRAGHHFYQAVSAEPYRRRLPRNTGYTWWVVVCDHGGRVVGWLTPGKTAQQTTGAAGPIGCYRGALTDDLHHPMEQHLGAAEGLDAAVTLVGTAHQTWLTTTETAPMPQRPRENWTRLRRRRAARHAERQPPRRR